MTQDNGLESRRVVLEERWVAWAAELQRLDAGVRALWASWAELRASEQKLAQEFRAAGLEAPIVGGRESVTPILRAIWRGAGALADGRRIARG